MSRSGPDGTDAARRTSDPNDDVSDWNRRHARVETPRTDSCVRATAPDDDWESRHAMTEREP